METYLYLLLKTQEQVFTAGSTKKRVSAVFFLVCTWPDIFPPQNRFMMPGPTHTLRSCYARFELAMGIYRALSWKVHHTYPKGICAMSITKMSVVTARDRHIFLGQWGKKRRSRHCFCTACNQGCTWFTVFPYLTMGRASSMLCSWDLTQEKVRE
jgi:hypothetical protein